MLGSLSAQAKEVELFCYTLKGHPHGTNFLIDTNNQRVWDNDKKSNKTEYEVISWSPQVIRFRDKPGPVREVLGYILYSIDRYNLDFYAHIFNKGKAPTSFFGKCELPRTQPQF